MLVVECVDLDLDWNQPGGDGPVAYFPFETADCYTMRRGPGHVERETDGRVRAVVSIWATGLNGW